MEFERYPDGQSLEGTKNLSRLENVQALSRRMIRCEAPTAPPSK